MILRGARSDDAAAIRSFFHASFAGTFGHLYAPTDLAAFFAPQTVEAWAAEIADPDIAFRLAFDGDRMVGLAKLSSITLPVQPQGTAAELRQLYLEPSQHGTGLARDLMDWVLDTARSRCARELFLSVFVDNHRARRFYARYGFEDVGRYAFMVGSHEDEDRIMRLTLDG